MLLESIHFSFKLRQVFFGIMKTIRSCRKILSDLRARFREHSNRLSYHRPFGIRGVRAKFSALSVIILGIVRPSTEEVYRQNSNTNITYSNRTKLV
jgi:hypothetical protein